MEMIVREDNTQRVFLSEGELDVTDILHAHYGYICRAMDEEGFILKYSLCNLFKELVWENKVVGFCTYDYSREFITAAINNIYVLPEFRGNHLFLSELEATMAEHNKPSIMEPTRLVVELLIGYGFATKVNENIVASAIEFVIPGDHVLSNSNYANEELSTHFYDLSICASIHILDLCKSHVAYSAPLNYDITNYDCMENRDGLGDEYFTGLTEVFKENDVELMNAILDLEENLPIKDYTLEEVIGGEGEFSFYIESLIDDAHVTRARAFEIKNQIRQEYEAGMILSESLLIRLAYLFNENTEPTITSHDDTCPYCSMPIDSHDRYCHFCGINLEYDPEDAQNTLLEYANTSQDGFSEDMRFVAYKFLKLIDEKIELEYSIFTIEQTYNILWDNLNEFLRTNNYFSENEITPEGFKFLNSHPLHFWQRYEMHIVNYSDFEDYFYAHDSEDPCRICLDYLSRFERDEDIAEIIDKITVDCLKN